MLGRVKQKPPKIIYDDKNKSASTPEDKIKVFTKRLMHQFDTNDLEMEFDIKNEVKVRQEMRKNKGKISPHKTIDYERLKSTGLDKKITDEEVKSSIKSFKQRAPGFSGITADHMKHLPNSMIKELTNLYNSILCTGYFPPIFKHAIIIMIPKPEKIKTLQKITVQFPS